MKSWIQIIRPSTDILRKGQDMQMSGRDFNRNFHAPLNFWWRNTSWFCHRHNNNPRIFYLALCSEWLLWSLSRFSWLRCTDNVILIDNFSPNHPQHEQDRLLLSLHSSFSKWQQPINPASVNFLCRPKIIIMTRRFIIIAQHCCQHLNHHLLSNCLLFEHSVLKPKDVN